MMQYQDQLKLQAYLDGELPEAEARDVANRLARDPDAVALLGELRQTRKSLAGLEVGVSLPESREFYWSKIQREIEREEKSAPVPEPGVSVLAWLRRALKPATGLAVLGIVALLALRGVGGSGNGFETALADSGAFTYHDSKAGATLVWLPYPAENEATDEEDIGLWE